MPEQTKYVLSESEMPEAWYNIQADLPKPVPAVLQVWLTLDSPWRAHATARHAKPTDNGLRIIGRRYPRAEPASTTEQSEESAPIRSIRVQVLDFRPNSL